MKLSHTLIVSTLAFITIAFGTAHGQESIQIGSGTEFVLNRPYPSLFGKPSNEQPFEVTAYVQNETYYKDQKGMIPGEPYCKLSLLHDPIVKRKTKVKSPPNDFELILSQQLTDDLDDRTGEVNPYTPVPFTFGEKNGTVDRFKAQNSKNLVEIQCFDDNGAIKVLNLAQVENVFGRRLDILKLAPMKGWAHGTPRDAGKETFSPAASR